ncbi:MAG: undecaprenyl-diphosphate phosphatase [bacterium]|nr:undecaprenyl-diphosphate phosphatase [bacterium]
MDSLLVLKAILLGIIEGLTEFIPASSTGHLILAGHWLQFPAHLASTFEITIQLGAILAVVILYKNIFRPFIYPKNWRSPLAINIMIATLPALGIGALTHTFIKAHLFSPTTVAIGLGIGGILMILVDKTHPPLGQTDSIDTITTKQALFIGIAQCAALWPGTSRSGATIVGGILTGLSAQTAAQFSFIIAVPIMIAAVTYDLIKTAPTLNNSDLSLIIIGFVTAFMVALLAIKVFLHLLKKWRLTPFGIYRIILAILVLL